MNITFLIGNGFDLNLGLDTAYSNFVKIYKNLQGKTDVLQAFQAHIDENQDLWAVAELEMGRYTSKFDEGAAEKFAECHLDFCEELARYLAAQQQRLNCESSQTKIRSAFSHMNTLTREFPAVEKEILDKVYQTYKNGEYAFNFICFNYTDTLDRCLDIIKQDNSVLGRHRGTSSMYSHGIAQTCHVHGTVEKDMVFGVNDESQIAKEDIFNCEDGDLYKNVLIKKNANTSYMENTDGWAESIIAHSHLIYIYGMSIGETDKLWWSRICNWLEANGDHHLIIYKHDMVKKSVIPISYQRAERQCKRAFLEYGTPEQAMKKDVLANQIHITNDNIFADMENAVNIVKYVEEDITKNTEVALNL